MVVMSVHKSLKLSFSGEDRESSKPEWCEVSGGFLVEKCCFEMRGI